MHLPELQRAVQAHMLAGGEPPAGLLAAVRPRAHWRAYTDAYRIRLVDALAKGFPGVARRLGTRTFGALMLDFVAAHPSVHRSLRDYGAELPAWLRAESADAAGPELAMLADLAAFEWLLAEAYDAPDAATVTHAELARVPPEHWGDLRFAAAPCVRRLVTTTNAVDVRRRVLDDEAADAGVSASDGIPVPAACTVAPKTWLVWREELDARYRPLDDAEARVLDRCFAGTPFGVLCESLEAEHGDRAALRGVTWLKTWTAEGLLSPG